MEVRVDLQCVPAILARTQDHGLPEVGHDGQVGVEVELGDIHEYRSEQVVLCDRLVEAPYELPDLDGVSEVGPR